MITQSELGLYFGAILIVMVICDFPEGAKRESRGAIRRRSGAKTAPNGFQFFNSLWFSFRVLGDK